MIVAVPTYDGRVPKFLIQYFNKIKGSNTTAVFIATYGNRDYEDALLELKNIFESKGFVGLAGTTFVCEHYSSEKIATGRPNVDDLSTATKLGTQIKIN